mgnify:CR=1 FL=1
MFITNYNNNQIKPILNEIKHYNIIKKYSEYIKIQDNNKINDILWELYHGYCYYNSYNHNNIPYHKNFEEIKNEIDNHNNTINICKKYLMLLNIDMIEYIFENFI